MKPKILFLLTAGLFAVSLPAAERNTTLSAPEWSAEVRSLLDFESLKGWEGGGEQVSSPVKHGRFAVRWAYDKTTGLTATNMPKDLSRCGTFSVWVHSAKANGAGFMIIFNSRRDAKSRSYFSHKVVVNWEGWRQVRVPFSEFHTARDPVGWGKIDSLRFTAIGWEMKPIKGTLLHLDQIEFLPGTAPTGDTSPARLYVPPPPADAFLKNLRKTHPRLLVTSTEVARLKDGIQSDPVLKAWYDGVKKEADSVLKAKPSVYEKPDGRRLLSTSRRVVDRVYNLGFVYLMGGGDAYLRRAWQEVEAAGNFPDWNPSHYLDTAEMMHGFGIAYDWLYHGLSEQERTFIREALYRHGLRLSYSAYKGLKAEGMQNWKKVENNWNFVCNGGSAIAAMAVLDEMPEPCQEILNAAFTHIQIPLAHFEPDGAWWEGVGYWGYSLRYFSPYLRCLETAFGTDFGFIEKLQSTGFSRTGDFPIYLVSPLGGFYNFADSGSGGGNFSHASFFHLADKFNNPLYHWFEATRLSHNVHDILYYRPSPDSGGIADMPLDRHFRETEVATLRNSWTDADATFVGFKAGGNGVGHSHDDLGSFVLDALGERWLVDLGTEHQTYLSHQHSHKRWEFYRIRAEGHNTLVINPGAGQDQKAKGEAKITRFESQPGHAYLACDLTDAYAGAKSIQRGIRFLDSRNTVLVQDEIETKEPAEIWWFAHTPGTITLGSDKRRATISRAGKKLEAVLLSPPGAAFVAMAASPLPGSPNPTKQENNRNYRKLAIHCQGQKLTLAVAFTPHYDFEEPPSINVPLTDLSRWTLPPASPQLAGVKVANLPLENFSPGVFAYWVYVDKATVQVPTITASARSAQDTVQIRPPLQVPGVAKIAVTDKQDATRTTRYRITFLKR